MKLNPKANLLVPDQKTGPEGFSRTTHLGIGAHQDDLEFMAYEGILACYDRADQWFGGVIMTDGRSSSRKGPYAGWTDDQIAAERVKEQHQAAIAGPHETGGAVRNVVVLAAVGRPVKDDLLGANGNRDEYRGERQSRGTHHPVHGSGHRHLARAPRLERATLGNWRDRGI